MITKFSAKIIPFCKLCNFFKKKMFILCYCMGILGIINKRICQNGVKLSWFDYSSTFLRIHQFVKQSCRALSGGKILYNKSRSTALLQVGRTTTTNASSTTNKATDFAAYSRLQKKYKPKTAYNTFFLILYKIDQEDCNAPHHGHPPRRQSAPQGIEFYRTRKSNMLRKLLARWLYFI